MSDEKRQGGKPAKADEPATPNDGDGNTADRPPEVTGGQPAVGDDLPRNTEF